MSAVHVTAMSCLIRSLRVSITAFLLWVARPCWYYRGGSGIELPSWNLGGTGIELPSWNRGGNGIELPSWNRGGNGIELPSAAAIAETAIPVANKVGTRNLRI
jgi:hypothetical protein